MLHIESEEEVMTMLFGVGHKTNMTSALFICRKKFPQDENAQLMPRSRARVDIAQMHRFQEFPHALPPTACQADFKHGHARVRAAMMERRFMMMKIIALFPYRLFVVMFAIISKFLLNALPVGESW